MILFLLHVVITCCPAKPMVLGICNKEVLQAQRDLSKARTNLLSGNRMDMY